MSFKRERPLPQRTVVPWDLRLVLDFYCSERFSSWSAVSDKDLTLKTVFLTALASGKRCSELHALTRNTKSVHGENKGIILSPDVAFVSKTQVKTSNLGALKPVFIPSLDNILGTSDMREKILCPVRSLKYYLQRVDQFRSPMQKKLFISWVKGKTEDIKKITFAHYIKQAIVLAYQEASPQLLEDLKITAHSVRHISTSLCALKNFSLEEVVAAGSWTSPNVFISHYLQNFTTDTLSGLHSVGAFVAAGTVIQ